MKRLLVTGSRDWADWSIINDALGVAYWELRDPAVYHSVVLVHGACHLGGADIIARDIWRSHGLADEPHPADMGPDGRVRGPERNQKMVDLGADLCLAFPLPGSRGTYDCIRRAEKAGIPVRIYTKN